MPPLIQSLRLHQWSKNLLLAVPALVAQIIVRPGVPEALTFAFVSFSLAASGNYLLNDVFDVEADRRHPEKRQRALASGRLPVAAAAVLAPLLIAAGLLIAALLVNRPYAMMIACYVVLALAYSKFFKRLLVLDVMTLAALYSLRLLAGGAAVDVAVSSWLLIFSMFFFISMAIAKRLTELDLLMRLNEEKDLSRAYVAADRGAFAGIGPAAGMLAVMVLAFYVTSDAVRAHWAQPDFLSLLCPLLLYWVLRVWIFALRGELHHDPVVFALTDGVSYAVAGAVLVVLGLAAGLAA